MIAPGPTRDIARHSAWQNASLWDSSMNLKRLRLEKSSSARRRDGARQIARNSRLLCSKAIALLTQTVLSNSHPNGDDSLLI